jgi:DNA-binding response OmpR family regulator
LKVLVVEDEYLIAMALADELEAAGALVLGPSSSVESALIAVERDAPAAAVLDVELQGKLITPVADALAVRGIPYILTTGHDSEALPPQFLDVPQCAKPATAEDVLTVLCAAMTARQGSNFDRSQPSSEAS